MRLRYTLEYMGIPICSQRVTYLTLIFIFAVGDNNLISFVSGTAVSDMGITATLQRKYHFGPFVVCNYSNG